MSTTSLQTRVVKAIEILIDKIYVPVSKTDIIIFVIGSAGAGKSTFLNTAISEDTMAVNHSIVSYAEDVECIKCTSPWNPCGRSVILAEIPAFDHTDTTIEKKIPELIRRWLNRTHCPEGPVDSGIIYLHSMDSHRKIDDFKKDFDSFATLCLAGRHRPTSALLVSTMGSSNADVIKKTKELEEPFKKTTPSSIRPIPNSVRFDGSRTTALKAIDSLILEIEKVSIWSISKTDTIIFVIGSAGAGKSTFINTAISENIMTDSELLKPSIADDIKSVKCTQASPRNLSERGIVFVEIPAFDPGLSDSGSSMRTHILSLTRRWLTKTSRPKGAEGPIKSGIIYLHSMTSQRTDNFNDRLGTFVDLCDKWGHDPTSVLLVLTQWCNESEEEMNTRTPEMEEAFQKAARSAHPIPKSVRFEESQISACNAIDLLMLDMMQ